MTINELYTHSLNAVLDERISFFNYPIDKPDFTFNDIEIMNYYWKTLNNEERGV